MDSAQELRDIKNRLESSAIPIIYKCFYCPKTFMRMINAQKHIQSKKNAVQSLSSLLSRRRKFEGKISKIDFSTLSTIEILKV